MRMSLGALEEQAQQLMARLRAERVVERLWAHDHTLWSPSDDEIANRLGWLETVAPMQAEIGRLVALREALVAEGFRKVLLLGMGGSSLAPEVFAHTFPEAQGLVFSMLDSTVPAAVRAAEEDHDPAQTVYIVSSKSGSTVETASLLRYFFGRACAALGAAEAGHRFIAITDPGSGLEQTARENGFREIFLNDPNIGGRYAALSLVGMVPAALIGLDLEALLTGASRAVAAAQKDDEGNHAAQLGAVMGAAALAGREKLTLLASEPLRAFPAWAEQLVAESTGKHGRGILPVVDEPVAKAYPSDRLFVALMLEGDTALEEKLARLEAQGNPVIRLGLRDRYDLGEQFFLWEFATAVAGWALSIHPFDQPDVESAKRSARAMVQQYLEQGVLELPAPTLAEGTVSLYGDVRGANVAEAFRDWLVGVNPRGYVAVHAYLPQSRSMDELLTGLRARIAELTGVAVTVGYGPRFLHSTGQLHKGDAGKGRFLQLTTEDAADLPIPDQMGRHEGRLGFGVLKTAQALGDAQALGEAGRSVVRLHVKGEASEALGALLFV